MKSTLTKQDLIPPDPGTYYRCRKAVSKVDTGIQVGDLVLVTEFDEEESKVHYARLDRTYFWDLHLFLQHYQLAPDGKAEREEDLRGLLNEFSDLKQEERQLSSAMQNLDRPLISSHEEALNSTLEEVAGKDEVSEHQNTALLVQTPDAIQARRIKKGVALMRNEALKFEKRMQNVQGRIAKMKEEQEAYLEAILNQTSSLQKMVKVAEELIWTVNIYLGRGEEIVQIRAGSPAAAEEKISVRQLVLFADEEMAFKPLEGGIDFKDLDQLDDWLLQKDNLQQVLPETRGIIAFKIKRKEKDYAGGEKSLAASMLNQEYNAKNKQTYFLMRNGENLYRVTTDISVGELLVPTSSEFDELFETSEYNYSTGEHTKSKVKPGTVQFRKAMETANEHQRHYGRVLLFMQGIIDRTKIFAPLMNESARVNLLDRKNHESYIRYIYDGQNLLPTGRLPFFKWLGEVNKNIGVGHRIIGIFNDYDYGFKRDRETNRHDRVTPGNADPPDNMTLHTIEGKRAGGFVVRYKRTDKIRRRYRGHSYSYRNRYDEDDELQDAKTRASCTVYPDDRFYIDFDSVNVDDMKFYLTSRVDRMEYRTMFPLIEATLALKQKEIKDESPFRKLLIGQIAKTYDIDFEEAESSIDELILWWKLKNTVKRAIAKDDSKALRMIVQEFGSRKAKENQIESSFDRIKFAASDIVESYAKSTQQLLYVGYRGTGYISALVAENDENIFVDEQIWRILSSSRYPEIFESRRWRTVDSRQLSWKELYKSHRWSQWRRNLRKDEYLTDVEIARLSSPDLWEKVRVRDTQYGSYRESPGTKVFWPLAISMNSAQEIRFWYYSNVLTFTPKKEFLQDRERIKEPQVASVTVSKKKVRGQHEFDHFYSVTHHDSHRGGWHETPTPPANRPWDKGFPLWKPQFGTTVVKEEKSQKMPDGYMEPRLLWVNGENIAKYESEFEMFCEAKKQVSDWSDLLFPKYQARDLMKKRWLAIEYQKYLADHGDPELWEDELKERGKKAPDFTVDAIDKACRQLIVRGKNLVGMTFGEIIGETLVKLSDVEAQYLPLDQVVLPEKSEEVEEETIETDDEEEDTVNEVWEKPVN